MHGYTNVLKACTAQTGLEPVKPVNQWITLFNQIGSAKICIPGLFKHGQVPGICKFSFLPRTVRDCSWLPVILFMLRTVPQDSPPWCSPKENPPCSGS